MDGWHLNLTRDVNFQNDQLLTVPGSLPSCFAFVVDPTGLRWKQVREGEAGGDEAGMNLPCLADSKIRWFVMCH